jgi:hypothetical protein
MLFYKSKFLKLTQKYNNIIEQNINLNNVIEKLKIELSTVEEERNKLLQKFKEIIIDEKNNKIIENDVTNVCGIKQCVEESETDIHKNTELDNRLTYDIILKKGFDIGFIDAKDLRNIDFEKEKIVTDYYEAIEELESKGIKINY